MAFRLNSSEIQSDIAKFLKRNPGAAYCDDCIRVTLHFSRSQASEQLMRRTASASGLLRQSGDCSICQVHRMITRAV
jgi:trehalose-6-phosphatase